MALVTLREKGGPRRGTEHLHRRGAGRRGSTEVGTRRRPLKRTPAVAAGGVSAEPLVLLPDRRGSARVPLPVYSPGYGGGGGSKYVTSRSLGPNAECSGTRGDAPSGGGSGYNSIG